MNPYNVVHEFEETIAEYAGSKYAVAVESCSAAIFLCCELLITPTIKGNHFFIPRFTYPSVPAAVIHAGGKVRFDDFNWQGAYEIWPLRVWDSALRFHREMYSSGCFDCLSFHSKKHLPIGRGGMILLDDEQSYNRLRRMRFDGRDEVPLKEDNLTVLGWNMYMTPEQAARGLQLFDHIKDKNLPDLKVEEQGYLDLSKFPIFSGGTRGDNVVSKASSLS